MDRRAPRLAAAVLAGVVLYVAVDVALVVLRPGFSVLHSAESDYGSAGPYAWVMDLNFVLRCLLSLGLIGALALAAERTRLLRASLWLLGAWAVASGLLAFFPDDPAGTRLEPAGRVHLALAGIAFVAVVAGTITATIALGRQRRFAPVLLPLRLLAYGALVPLLLLGHGHLRRHSLGGLYEKLFLALELAWIAVCAWWITRLPPAGPPR